MLWSFWGSGFEALGLRPQGDLVVVHWGLGFGV